MSLDEVFTKVSPPLKVTATSTKGYPPVRGYIVAKYSNVMEIKKNLNDDESHFLVGMYWTYVFEVDEVKKGG